MNQAILRSGTPANASPRERTSEKAELTEKTMFMLFPVPLFTGKLSDLGVCDRAEKKIKDMHRSGQGSSARSRMLAFMTRDDLQTLPEMAELVDVIMKEAGQILDAYKIKRDSHYITNMWANITNPNRRHHLHSHPNCLLSGLLYVKTPQNCGPTMFASPRLLSTMLTPKYTEKTELNSDMFVFPAEKGRMLIWPSHLSHGVDDGTAKEDEDRIIIAFNIMIRGLIDGETMRLELK